MARAIFSKTSAPSVEAGGGFNTPGNDVIYTLTITNPTGTTIDAGSVVLNDLLPDNVVFRNSPFDGATSSPIKLASSGGLSLAGSSISYRQSGSASFTYTPSAGYDNQVAEIRITPGGELAANSSAVFQFKAQVE